MYMIHLRTGEDCDLVIFCQDPIVERKSKEYKGYVSDGFKEIGHFDLNFVDGQDDLPYSVEGL